MEFVHLHIHTEYSLLDSTVRIEELVEKAFQYKMRALAITDKDVLHGVIPFYKKCKSLQIKPIIGMELWVRGIKLDNDFPVILLAENNTGYMSLIRLSTMKQTTGYVDFSVVMKEIEHCIVIIPYADSEPASLLRTDRLNDCRAVLHQWKQALGQKPLFLERQSVGQDTNILNIWKQLSVENEIPMIAGNNVHMMNKTEKQPLSALRAIDQGVSLSDVRQSDSGLDGSFLSMDEMEKELPEDRQAVKLTAEIADKCHVTLQFNDTHMPKYPLTEENTAKDTLRKWCDSGLRKRYKNIDTTVQKRLEYELEIIEQMGFQDYFLIVADFVKYAREKGILVGPGRGSAAGSLVAYVLEITDIDPIAHHLLFERFLNPERVSLPDIDIDFPDYRRDEVIEYVWKKYGYERVARIVTFGTFGARAAVRDAGRVLEAPSALVDRLASLIPQDHGVTLKKAIESEITLQRLMDKEPKAQLLMQLASKIEGLPRHTSVHAAGLVMSEEVLTTHVPLMKKNENVLLTQYPMDILEDIGLIKMDFLGLKNLSLLEHIMFSIRREEGKKINIRQLPTDDPQTFKRLAAGDTTGIFQLESAGMREALRQVKPTAFEDIAAVNALYRPGPMESIPVYARRKHGKEELTYLHDDLKEILSPTYGVIIYQEQIMQIAAVMAGYSYGEADLFRRAVSKKKHDVLEEERARFIDRATGQGYTLETASNVYDLILRFANYGFNRSHAVAYSYIAYQLAYLKTHYPSHFYAALLTMNQNNSLKIGSYQREAVNKNVTIRPPSINKSRVGFYAKEKDIYYGFLALKYVNISLARAIVSERNNGYYQSFIDFLMRISINKTERKGIESLIKAGAFDELENDRAKLLASLDQAIEYAEFQKDLGGLLTGVENNFRYVDTEPFSDQERYEAEKEATGHYLTGHPLEKFQRVLKPFSPLPLHKELPQKGAFWTAGIIDSVKAIRTRNGEAMSFLTITDGAGEAEVVIFPSVHRKVHSYIEEQVPVLLEGRKDKKDDKKILADHVLSLEELLKQEDQTLFLKIPKEMNEKQCADKVKQILNAYPGNVRVLIYYEKFNKTIQLADRFRTFASAGCLRELKRILSEKSVVLKR